MNRRDRTQHHTALMLLACAFAFVYLLARQFQWPDIVDHRHAGTKLTQTQTPPLPTRLTGDVVEKKQYTSPPITTKPSLSQSWLVWFSPLNSLPQSFVRLGLSRTQGILIDAQKIIISTDTNSIKRSGDSKTLTWWELKKIWLTGDSLTFYNHPSWANIMVVMEIVRNKQSVLMQIPYTIYRDHKSYLNSVISQLTQ